MQDKLDRIRQFFIGRPMRAASVDKTLLPKRIALPIFASDALSSVAYAPDEILITLSLAGGAAASFYSGWVGLAVVCVLALVVLSYRQTVHAYPNGGGVYEVVTSNFGNRMGLVAASALLVDYVLTVAVSISSGTQYLVTAIPFLQGQEVLVALTAVALLALVNLRGVREAGSAFAIPTYLYIFMIMLLGGMGIIRHFTGNLADAPTAQYEILPAAQYANGLMGIAGVLLVLRAFSSGCAALTGVEAVSNGVPMFRRPKSKNAATTLAMLGGLSATMMFMILYLANVTGAKVVENPAEHLLLNGQPIGKGVHVAPIIGQLASSVFAEEWVLFLLVTLVTGMILFLAANTAFNGFPTLASVLSRDSFLPHQLYNQGDRLNFSNGIFLLAAAAGGLIAIFDAQTTRLIQLYIIGVFVSFTLSQLGMVKHWSRLLALESSASVRKSMRRSRVINLLGACITALIFVVVLITKFVHGAWIALLMMVVLFFTMRLIRKHYDRVRRLLEVPSMEQARRLPSRVHAVVLVSRLQRPAMRAIAYARASHPSTLEIATVAINPDDVAELKKQWAASGLNIALTVIASPYREVARPAVNYIRSLRRRSPSDLVVVYLPEFLVEHWWQKILHNQTAFRIRSRLMKEQGVVVAMVPYQIALEPRPQWAKRNDRDDEIVSKWESLTPEGEEASEICSDLESGPEPDITTTLESGPEENRP